MHRLRLQLRLESRWRGRAHAVVLMRAERARPVCRMLCQLLMLMMLLQLQMQRSRRTLTKHLHLGSQAVVTLALLSLCARLLTLCDPRRVLLTRITAGALVEAGLTRFCAAKFTAQVTGYHMCSVTLQVHSA